MYLLDTNVISELRHGKPRQSSEVRAWAVQQPNSRLFLSAISLLELEMAFRHWSVARRPKAISCGSGWMV